MTNIQMSASGNRVSHLSVCSASGRRFTVSARVYVLAAGGIENARLLLDSNRVQTAGVGNDHDLVGRFFMDHHRVDGGRLIPFNPRIFDRASLYDLRVHERGRYVQGKFTIAQDAQRQERILNNSTAIWPLAHVSDDAAADSLKALMSAARNRRLVPGLTYDIRKVVAGRRYLLGTGLRLMAHQRTFSPSINRGGWSHLPDNAHRFREFLLIHQCEQAPSPDNRVTLSDDRDHFGRRRAHVHTHWSEIDLRSLCRVHEMFARQFEERGIGRIVREADTAFPSLHQLGGLHHHLGTTRMHNDPKQGVVNSDGRVHGVDNLYTCGSSTFPTGGYANPTLTIIALAVRLADHLKVMMARSDT